MVFETVRRARQRMIANEALRYAAYAVSAAFLVLIALLLVGTEVLSWVWLIVAPILLLAAGAYLTWRRAPSLYRTAQRVDRNLALSDTISTALFFASSGQEWDLQPVQREQAEKAASAVDLAKAAPLRLPRASYGAAILALAAGSLFLLRYGLEHRLDLHRPLARIVQDRLGYTEAARNKRAEKPPARDPKHPEQAGLTSDPAGEKKPGELDAAPDSALDTVGVPDVDNKIASSKPAGSKLSQSAQLEGGKSAAEEPQGLGMNPSAQQPQDAGQQGPGAGKQGQQGKADDKQGSGNPAENSGLLGKFRDAMSSLMNRMRPQQGAQQNGGQQKAQAGNPAAKGQQGQQPGDGQKADSKGSQAGEQQQEAQAGQSGSPGENGPQPATKQPGSGIGRQDGSKDVKLAEQLAAMGKISEIIGKRTANVSGELTVEVESNNRQLRTPYVERDAHHGQAGAEINRDEVPAALQSYVQQCFEQVRKQAPKPKAPEPSKPAM